MERTLEKLITDQKFCLKKPEVLYWMPGKVLDSTPDAIRDSSQATGCCRRTSGNRTSALSAIACRSTACVSRSSGRISGSVTCARRHTNQFSRFGMGGRSSGLGI